MVATYTYDFDSAPQISYVRLLVPDTSFLPNVSPPQMIFSDQEINAFFQIQRLSGFQSSMFFSGAQGRFLPNQPVSYYRVAALALDTLANNKAKLGGVLRLLDVTLQRIKDVSDALRDGAKSYRDLDDDSGALMIIEQTNTDWSFRDRWTKQYQRQAGSFA